MDLASRITQANTLLAPYAVPHGGTLGREQNDTEERTRFPFQRDRDRVIHSDAFRRLKHKTQVFVAVEGDHFRTRLTHTLEVAQISRDMARTLSLNEDLAECIALAHDLGHTPFGHAGEEAMHECMEPYGKRFEHNEQSYRICTVLEKRKEHAFGLNLNREVLEGLMKHATPHDTPTAHSLTHSPTIEAQLVNIGDEIAYTSHDMEDGMRAELFSLNDIKNILPKNVLTRHEKDGTSIRSALIDFLVEDIYGVVRERTNTLKLSSLDDVYRTTDPIVAFSHDVQAAVTKIREFLWTRMYLHPLVKGQADEGKMIIKKLFVSYMKNPPVEVSALRERFDCDLEDAVKDYIAGMTDTFAMSLLAS